MGFLVIIPFAGLAAWCILRTSRVPWQPGYGTEWRRAFGLLLPAGIGLGIWFGIFAQYGVANKRLHGFPIPTGISSREKPGDPWQKSALPAPVRWGALITDVLGGVALGLAPLAVAAFLRENRIRRDAGGRPVG